MHQRVCGLALLVLCASGRVGFAQNCSCEPPHSGSRPSGNRTVWISPDFQYRNEIIAAMDNWNTAMANVVNGVSFDVVPDTNANVIMRVVDDPGGQPSSADNDNGEGVITVPRHLADFSAGLMQHIATHELGHTIGFMNMSSCSQADSVMYESINISGPFPGITCAD